MPQIKLEDILLLGVKLEDCVRKLTEDDLVELRKSIERQKKILKSKIIRPETLNLRITI